MLGGQIPDASLIHMARKRRQQARERGDDFIPLDNTAAANQGKKSSRLIRFVVFNLLPTLADAFSVCLQLFCRMD
jgi:hypothetical protein